MPLLVLDAFNIKLVDQTGYYPAIDNILFIPEPATIILLAAGLIFVRRKR